MSAHTQVDHKYPSLKFLRLKYLIAVCVVICVTGFASIFIILNYPYSGSNESVTFILIKPGDGLNRISSHLAKRDLILSPFIFKWAAIGLGKSKSIKSGEYRIDGKLTSLKLINLLSDGKTILHRVTIPEGTQMKDIFQTLESAGIGKKNVFVSVSQNIDFINSLGISLEITSLEGFLFPETYFFSKSDTEKTIIAALVKTFLKQIPENYPALARNVGLTFYEAITLASIIEKETAVASERKLIASVMHNRLRDDMLLQTDPTVIYGIKDFDGNLTRKQLRTITPYNTYKIKGLPPTPIANPGLDSLMAAVSPEKTNFKFFVAKGDGTHLFTNTYEEHKKAVYRYQKQRRKDYKSF